MKHKRNPNTKCSVCGKPFYRRPSEFEEGKEFCCKGCRGKLYKRKPSIWKINLKKGFGWNKGLSKANGDRLVYGKPRSEKTKKLISKRLKEVLEKNGKIINCPICGEPFYVYPCYINDERRGIVCSKRCARILGNINQKTEDTDIELILEEWLKEKKINYQKQFPLCGITIVDFFIKPNICLYADGDYWHTLDVVKQRDSEIDSKLEMEGYNVIRLWGSEIKDGVRPNEILQ